MRKLLIPLIVVVATVGVFVGGLSEGLEGGEALWTFAWIMWAPIGGLILWKRPGNGIGATMLFIGLAWGLGFWLMPVMTWDLSPQSLAWAELFNTIFGALPWLGVIWLLLVFPSGRLTGRLERLAGASVVVLGVYASIGFMINPEPMEVTGLPSPLAIEDLDPVTEWLVSDAGFFLVIGLVAAMLVSLIRRWSHSEGLERHQFRWLLFGTGFYGFVLTVGQLLPEGNAFLYLWVLAGWAIPAAVAVAVLRYRLYDIDRLISRTVTYTLVVGLLALTVALVATVTATQFENPLVVAATTLGVAALFNPLRKQVEALVDRRFNRSRYDTQRVMDQFAGSLRDRVDPEGVVAGWVGVVEETMQPRGLGVWVRGRS